MTGFIAPLLQTAMGILKGVDPSLVTNTVYTPGGTAVYDTTTGAVTVGATTYTFDAVYTKFGENDIDALVVVSTDARLLVAGLDLGGHVPDHTDTMVSTDVYGNVTKWKVVRVMGVPTSGFWKIHVRRV